MTLTVDLSLLATLFGIVVVLLTGLIYWGKPNFLIFLQKGIISEMAKGHRGLLDKAEKYSHGTRLSGPKIRIKRMLSRFAHEYSVPNSVLVVSGLASVAWLFSLFLVVLSFLYFGIQESSIIDTLLLGAQTNLAVMLLMGWFGRNNSVEQPVLFLISSFAWWFFATMVATIMGLSGLSFHVIAPEQLHIAFYSFAMIPFIPIAWSVCVTAAYYRREHNKYNDLKKAVTAFEKFRLEESQKSKKK